MVRIVTDYLDDICKKMPNKAALCEENKQITFAEMQREARQIASCLSIKGIFRKPIAVYLDKGINVITSFLGCAYSGNFYSPIDPDMPLARVKSIFETLEPECIITCEKYADRIKGGDSTINVLIYSDMTAHNEENELLEQISKKITDRDVLYVLFTSGSTGSPKGVIISHHSVISYTEWAAGAFDMTEKDILGNQTPFYFSMSVFDIFQTISRGCTMEILPKELFSNPEDMITYLTARHVNTIYWVPSAMNILAKSGLLEKNNITFLKKILFAGEVMPNSILNIWRKANPKAYYANLFGPTELTDICTYYEVNRSFRDEEPLPIGRACLNTDILVLNEKDELMQEGDMDNIGELCVRGSTLAYGYYRNKEKTKEVFVQNPLNKVYGEIIYRTGDLVKYNAYGELMYVGRKDFQVKVSGYRIELGEIETAASSVSEVRLNCCLFDAKNQLLVLFYEGEITKKELRARLKKLLPRYMMPHRYVELEKMPLNANGKIDRVKLKMTL